MADRAAKPEALRLKLLAETKFKSGDIDSAIKYAKRAQRLSPSLPGLSEMITSFKILHAAAGDEESPPLPDYYKILQVEPFSHINIIKKQYKKLALSLHPDKNSGLGSEEAFKAVGDAFRVLSDRIRRKDYDLKLRIRLQEEAVGASVAAAAELVETFWTACSRCKLLHQFERKYLRQNLVCPSCRNSFLAVEIGDEEEGQESEDEIRVSNHRPKRKASVVRDDDSNSSESSGDDDELTLAEMQLLAKRDLKREKFIPKKIAPFDVDRDSAEPPKVYSRGTWRRRKTAPETAVKRSKPIPSKSPEMADPEFFDFDQDRTEKRFKKGQVWATYNNADGMPRRYCLIEDVVSTNPFEVRVGWLDLQDKKKPELDTACGRYRVSRKCTLQSASLFSHVVDSERAARETYWIYPRKGSVWAIYGTDKGLYSIAVFLTSYSDAYGLSMAYLERVDGFRTVFRRRDIGAHAVRFLDRVGLCSHQVPAKKIVGDEVPNHLQGSWELDPASLPLESLVLPPTDDR